MTNYEKHKDEMIKYSFTHNECGLKRKLFGIDCGKARCGDCMKLAEEWLEAEYTEEIDWSKVEQGTKVYYAKGIESAEGLFISQYDDRVIIDLGFYVCKSYNKYYCRLEK